MKRLVVPLYCAFLLLALLPLQVGARSHDAGMHHSPGVAAANDLPRVDPDYIYTQLDTMVTSYQHREAGYDANLPAAVNGHDEFADYWSKEMQRDLQGLNPQVLRDSFSIPGWQGRPATVPAFNVEVTVPGATHPEQVVVIGCHYDGMAFSTQSANDDGSGCAIELGVAKAMGDYWRAHHSYPARTLRFVIFDAEESGIFGSFHYLNSTVNGDIQNIVAMFNEEQSGIGYPLRYLGQMQNPLLPFEIDLAASKPIGVYAEHGEQNLSPTQVQNINHFRDLARQVIPSVFQQFRAMGIDKLTYHDANHKDVAQPIFTPDQLKNVDIEDDDVGLSDQMPFTFAGLPCATMLGNTTYYQPKSPPAWSYPYDQPQDTIQLMNTFANGSSHKAAALTLSLALPAVFTTTMLQQPDILGETTALPAGQPIVAISDVGQTQAGQPLSLNAHAAFDPQNSNATLNYAWDFGDGATATGVEVKHTYTSTGTYTITLTVSAAGGKSQVRKAISVVSQSTPYVSLYLHEVGDGEPLANSLVTLPKPDDSLADAIVYTTPQPGQVKVTPTPGSRQSSTVGASGGSSLPWLLLVIIALAVIALFAGSLLLWGRRRR